MFVLNFIKKLITFEGENTFNVGDIIWAKRYKTQSEKERIKVGHQSSPYVIIKKKAGKIYALQSTSNLHLEVQWKMVYYPLGRLNYNLQKNSYLNCSREYEVEKEQILSKIGHLTDYDMNQIRKQIYILQKSDFSVKPNIEKKYLKYKVEAGDIILKGDRRYYIYFLDRKYFYCYRLRERIKINKNILIDNTYYSFVFKKVEKIKRNCKYDLVDTFNSGEIEIVNNYIIDEIQKLNAESDKTSMIGALIKYDDKMYYIYEENETIAFVYRVYPYGDKIEDFACVRVKNGLYKTKFEFLEISKENFVKGRYKKRRRASDDEIAKNEEIFHLSKRERKLENKKLFDSAQLSRQRDISYFVPMTIIQNVNNKKYYLIISRNDNVIEVVNINEISDMYFFELEENNCPFKYYRVFSKQEYDIYLKKVNELKDMVAMFQ